MILDKKIQRVIHLDEEEKEMLKKTSCFFSDLIDQMCENDTIKATLADLEDNKAEEEFDKESINTVMELISRLGEERAKLEYESEEDD